MNPFHQLLKLSLTDLQQQGLAHTPAEIAQQPQSWHRTAQLVAAAAADLKRFVEASPRLVFSGAGTSHYIGLSLETLFRRAGLDAMAIPSTEITIDPEGALPPRPLGLVSFARSGNSPETNQAFREAARLRPGAPQLVITCNPEGELYRLPGATRLLLPPETNDRGLAMTSSYTSMVIAAQGLVSLADLAGYERVVDRMASMAQQVMDVHAGALADAARMRPLRALFLGTGSLLGAATEAHLKVQEMTGGRVLGKAESFLGLRHGPMAAVDDQTLVVCFLSAAPAVRRYELDLMRELKAKGLGARTLAISDDDRDLAGLADAVLDVDPAGADQPLDDDRRPPVYVVAAQLLALFLSLELGLKPDAPSDGVINRVVQGVRIYSGTEGSGR